MAKILILNGSPRKNGKTYALVKAFMEGASESGNEIKEAYIQGMKIGGCLACNACARNDGTCIQKDDMDKINDDYLWADVIVFASPMYWGTITGQLKIVIDRFFALQNRIGMQAFGNKSSVMIMTAGSTYYQMAHEFYSIFQSIGFKNLGEIYGAEKINEARQLGLSIM